MSILINNKFRTIYRDKPVKWIYCLIVFNILVSIDFVDSLSKCQKALDAAAAVTAHVLAENSHLTRELLNKQHRHFQFSKNEQTNQFHPFSTQSLPNILDSDTFDQPDVNQMVSTSLTENTNLPSNLRKVHDNVATHSSSIINSLSNSMPSNSPNNMKSNNLPAINLNSKLPPESSLLVSQETRAFRARPQNSKPPMYNKVNPQQFLLRGLTNVNDNLEQNPQQQFIVKPTHQLNNHHHKASTSSTNQSPHYYSSRTFTTSSSSFFNNLRPYILHTGDIYVAYFDCIDQNSLNVERTSPLVQSAMSAVWAAHRLNQLNSTTTPISIKLGVYYFDICSYDPMEFKETKEFGSNSVDEASSNSDDYNQFNQRKNPKLIADDKQIENYLKLIEYNNLSHNNWSSNNRNGIGVIPKTGVRSYQRNGKQQQVHKMRPIVGILVDVSRMHPSSVLKLNKMDLPVINTNQLPDYDGWPAEPGVSLGKRIFNVYPAVQQLCKGVFNLVKKLNWTFAVLDFSKFENSTSTNDNQIERKLSPQQQIFVRCLSKLAARDTAFTFRLDSTDGQIGQSLDNEIIFLTSSKSQTFMNALVAGYLSNKPNRIIATLENLGAQLDNAIIEHHLAGKNFYLPFRKGRSLEEFNQSNGPFFIQPDFDVTTDFFDFFNIELRNANIQSKHRLMSKLSEQLLFKAFNSTNSITFTEKELNAIRPVVHYFRDNESNYQTSNGEIHQKFNKLNHNLTKLLKSRNLFEVTNNPAVVHVIKGVWALGLTLSKLVKNVCISTGLSAVDRKRNCINRLQQVFDTDKQFVRNITVNLNEKVNIKMSNQMNNTFEDRIQFDKNLQLTTIHYTVNRLNNSQLVKIAYYTECCGLRPAYQTNSDSNIDFLNASIQPMLFNNAYSILSSSNLYQINRPTQSTPTFGQRLSTRKTTIFIKPTKQTSTTVAFENNIDNRTEIYSPEITEHSSSPANSPSTDITRLQSEFTTVDSNSQFESNSKSTTNSISSESTETNDSTDDDENDNTTPYKNKIETSTLGTTMSTIEVIRITAEPESNDVDSEKLDKQQNYTKITTESLNKRNNPFGQLSNQTRYIVRKTVKKTIQDTGGLSYLSNRRKSTTLRPYVREQIQIKNGKIYLNNTASSKNNAKSTIASVVISDRHSLNQFRKDNEVEIERRFSICVLFLSIGGSLLTLYVFIFLLVKSCEGALRHHSHQALALTQLIAILIVYFSSGFYVFQINSYTINLRNSIHNVALALLFACLLQRALFLRAQKWIGLGGKISMLNQFITLLLIFGVQLALEVQKWSYETSTVQDLTNADLIVIKSQANANQFINGQCYLMIISCLLLIVSFSARQQPFTYKEGKHIYLTSLICCPLYLGSVLFLYKYLITMNYHNQQLQSVTTNSSTLFNLTNAQSLHLPLQWSSNTLFLNTSSDLKIANQTNDDDQFYSNITTINPLNDYTSPTTVQYSNTTTKSTIRSSVEYLPKPLNLALTNDSKDLIKLFNQPTFDFLQAIRSNVSNNFEFLESFKEYSDYQHKLTVIKFVDLVQSFILLVLATVTLFGIFGPIVITIHKYGVLPKKQNNSYADSLSTAFTLFKTGSNSQQQFVINKNVKSKTSFLNPFAFNQRKKENNSLNVHSQFKQLTNSLQSPTHLQCSSATITGDSSATSESSFTNTDNISNTDLTDQSPTTSHHHFHHNQTKKQKTDAHNCESESNDEDGLMNDNNEEMRNEISNNQIDGIQTDHNQLDHNHSEHNHLEHNAIDQLEDNQLNHLENKNATKNLVRPKPPPLPSDLNLLINNKLNSSVINKSPSHIGCGKHFNYAKTPSSTYDNYHKSFKYVMTNLVTENNLVHSNHHHHHHEDIAVANIHTNGHSKMNLHSQLPNLINNTYDSSKPRLIRTNPLYEENQFRSAYP